MKRMRVIARKEHWSDWKYSKNDSELYCPECAKRLEEQNETMVPLTKNDLKFWTDSEGNISLDCATDDCYNYLVQPYKESENV